MEQRRLRLGDILDDYCPRERRVTNHAVVAMIDEDVKQTRCTTCDAEHVYKGGQAPRRRKAASAALVAQGRTTTAQTDLSAPHHPHVVDEPVVEAIAAEPAMSDEHSSPVDAPEPEPDPEPQSIASDEGPVHRPLIRATLPRPEGIKVERPVPEFTIRQNIGGRGNGNFRARAQGNGGRPGSGSRFGRGSQGHGRGMGQGFGRGASGQQQRHGGQQKKRSR